MHLKQWNKTDVFGSLSACCGGAATFFHPAALGAVHHADLSLELCVLQSG